MALMLCAVSACKSGQPHYEHCARSEMEIREAVAWYVVSQYENLPPQFDDPIGHQYCLGFDFSFLEDGVAAPESFLARFSADTRIHSLDWCSSHDGRLVSVGPVECLDSAHANAWSFTWMESRPSGADCLHDVMEAEGRWVVLPDCIRGNIYN